MISTSRAARVFGASGGVGLFLGVALGAFAAHLLQARLSPRMLNVFETGVRYQMYHSLALLAAALFAERGKMFRFAGVAYMTGIVLFSFSLYALALTGIDSLGLITPLGGVSFLAGHLFLLLGFLKI